MYYVVMYEVRVMRWRNRQSRIIVPVKHRFSEFDVSISTRFDLAHGCDYQYKLQRSLYSRVKEDKFQLRERSKYS